MLGLPVPLVTITFTTQCASLVCLACVVGAMPPRRSAPAMAPVSASAPVASAPKPRAKPRSNKRRAEAVSVAPVDLAGVASVPPAPVKASVDTTSLAAPVTAAKPRAKLAPRSYKQQAVASSPAPIVIAEAAPLSPLPPPVPESIPVDDDGDSQASTIAADTPGVQHEVVVPPPRRAKSSRGLGLKHDSSTFHELATEGKHNIRRDIKNRISNFPLPIKGDADCEFNGKVDGSTEILTSDLIRFEWSYRCDVGGFVVSGKAMSHHRARAVIYSKLPPRMPRNAMDAFCIAKIYEKFFENPGLAPFVRKHCASNGGGVTACRIFRIGYPKPAQAVPQFETFVDSSGASCKWLVCADAGPDKKVCHPGPLIKFSDNRLTYNIADLRVFNVDERKEAKPVSFKRRKRVCKNVAERTLPTTLEEINGGLHRGCRDVLACAACLAECEEAVAQQRPVTVDKALSQMLLDPFAWDETATNRLFVLWRAPDGQHHLDAVTMRHLMKCVADPREP